MTRSTNVFAPVIFAVALTVLAAVVALVSWSGVRNYLPELNIETPPIQDSEPWVATAPPKRMSRRVVLVIVDGLRLSSSFARPTFDKLRRQGVDAIANSHYPTISRPNHTALVTGVPPLASGVRNNTYRVRVEIDSIMDRLRAAGLRSVAIADDSPSFGYLFGDDFESVFYGRWPGALLQAVTRVLDNTPPDLLVLLPGQVDLEGHRHGAASPEYDAAIRAFDENLAEIVGQLDLSQDTIIVTADHGHTDRGGHGGEEQEVIEVPLIIAGAGINRDALLGEADLVDIAPTIAALLGVPAPGHSVGRTLEEVLAASDADKVRLARSDRDRIKRNVEFYLASVREHRDERIRARNGRLLSICIVLILALLLLEGARRAGALHVDWRVLLIAVPAYPLCYYGLLNFIGSLSFSALQDRGSEMSALQRFGLVAMLAQVLAGWLALQGRVVLRDRLAAANAFIAYGLVVASFLAGIVWALHGPSPHLEIPRSRLALLIPANYTAVATYALGATVLLGLEIVVFFARAVDPRIRLRRLERAAERERRRIDAEKSRYE